jgi:hypothetical protein
MAPVVHTQFDYARLVCLVLVGFAVLPHRDPAPVTMSP